MLSVEEAKHRPVSESLREYGRGVVGGLLFSLPILYTMEMWWTGFLAGPRYLLGYIAVTLLLLLGYNRFAGMRSDATLMEVAIDSVEEMGLGLVLSALVLWLSARLTSQMPLSEMIGRIVVEAMTVAIGVSVGTAQLGISQGQTAETTDDSASRASSSRNASAPPNTKGQLVLAFCGAILFAANIAPTEEVLVIGIEASPVQLLGLLTLSLLMGATILFYSGFVGSDAFVRSDGWFWIAFGVLSTYAAALLASALTLWFFRRFEGGAYSVAVAQTVVLGFPAMLGASAGRLLIQ